MNSVLMHPYLVYHHYPFGKRIQKYQAKDGFQKLEFPGSGYLNRRESF